MMPPRNHSSKRPFIRCQPRRPQLRPNHQPHRRCPRRCHHRSSRRRPYRLRLRQVRHLPPDPLTSGRRSMASTASGVGMAPTSSTAVVEVSKVRIQWSNACVRASPWTSSRAKVCCGTSHRGDASARRTSVSTSAWTTTTMCYTSGPIPTRHRRLHPLFLHHHHLHRRCHQNLCRLQSPPAIHQENLRIRHHRPVDG